jgi:hypothetical protein
MQLKDPRSKGFNFDEFKFGVYEEKEELAGYAKSAASYSVPSVEVIQGLRNVHYLFNTI